MKEQVGIKLQDYSSDYIRRVRKMLIHSRKFEFNGRAGCLIQIYGVSQHFFHPFLYNQSCTFRSLGPIFVRYLQLETAKLVTL